jgi:hypothetical protein
MATLDARYGVRRTRRDCRGAERSRDRRLDRRRRFSALLSARADARRGSAGAAGWTHAARPPIDCAFFGDGAPPRVRDGGSQFFCARAAFHRPAPPPGVGLLRGAELLNARESPTKEVGPPRRRGDHRGCTTARRTPAARCCPASGAAVPNGDRPAPGSTDLLNCDLLLCADSRGAPQARRITPKCASSRQRCTRPWTRGSDPSLGPKRPSSPTRAGTRKGPKPCRKLLIAALVQAFVGS